MPAHLTTRNLTRRFRSGERRITVLDNVTFDLDHGESLAVLGPSGSGKSTLLALIAGLDRPSEGGVWIDGEPVHEKDEDELALLRRHHIGFVFQSFQLLANRTALENVALPLELLGDREAVSSARELLDRVGLAERAHHYPTQLSGGEQQRVALARAFVHRPKLLLADEPTGNLDRDNGLKVLEILAGLRRQLGTTLVLVTHDPIVAERADRRAQLTDGRMQFD